MSYSAVKGQVLSAARAQLDTLVGRVGMDTEGISNVVLKKALESKAAYDAAYTGLTRRAIDAFAVGKRVRACAGLQCSLATLSL